MHGIFTSVSATTNAGFDITGESLVPYHNDYFVQIITALLIVFGAIGFPVLIEVKEFLFNKNKNFRFSLFTKLTTITYGILLVLVQLDLTIKCLIRLKICLGTKSFSLLFSILFRLDQQD